jgi:hypothetical protein
MDDTSPVARAKIVGRSMADLNPSVSRHPTDLAKSAEVGLTKNDSISITYEFRTKCAQSGALENNGQREGFLGLSSLSQCGGLRAEARIYWGFLPLASQRRMLNAGGLAEGEELGSNILQVARRTPANCSENTGHAPTLRPREVTRQLSLELGEVARDHHRVEPSEN